MRIAVRSLGIGRFTFIRGGLRAVVAAALALGSAGVMAPTATAGPIGVWLQTAGNGCPGGVCVTVVTTSVPAAIPLSTSTAPDLANVTAEADVTAADTAHLFLSSSGGGGFSTSAWGDTYTVSGNFVGDVPITATLRATGTARSVATSRDNRIVSGSVMVEIGAFHPEATSGQFAIDPFAPGGLPAQVIQKFPTQVSASPFSHPIDVQVSYTTSVHVGQVFDLGFDAIAALGGQGTLDLSHTAEISFALPDGLVLTSALGGTYGNVPEPASLALLGLGLAGIGAVGRTRRDGSMYKGRN